MKQLKLVLSIALVTTAMQLFAQTDKETTVKILNEQKYTFVANSAIPMANMDVSQVLSRMPGGMGGGMINLTGSQYDLRVTKDSVVAFLPYFGRAFNAPTNPSEGGIKFTSKDFSYKESTNKKGARTILINTKDNKRENYRLTLNVSTNGYATLVATGNNKQPITFNGYLNEPKK
ncbi:DUF4251 domain-containing protein [Pedobacter sandarakinus]|uniref:DUF4251 domain-containing protein n=1 Tax=Pedobacter sandarakinus TaxID=353156 RepID=UPI0022482DB1|nr:DUF4251 domain-containing protein [Pedobacter sandarakinus]MCX2573308.1 DUF4251 domain-containing protein [Pedobacter sandarakinus]